MIFFKGIYLAVIAAASLASGLVSPGEVRVSERSHENPKHIRGIEHRLQANRRAIASTTSLNSIFIPIITQNVLFPTFYSTVVARPVLRSTSTSTSTLKVTATSTSTLKVTSPTLASTLKVISTSISTSTVVSTSTTAIPTSSSLLSPIPIYSYNNPECLQGAGAILGNCGCTKSSFTYNLRTNVCDPFCSGDSYPQSLPFGIGTCICKFGLYDTRTNSCISICAPGFTPTGQPGNCWCASPSILNMETLTCNLRCYGNLKRSINQLGYPVCA